MKFIVPISAAVLAIACSNGGGSNDNYEKNFSTSTSESSSSSQPNIPASSSQQSSSSSEPVPVNGYQLVSFEVLGSDGMGSQTTVNPYLDEGEFGLSWTVENVKTPYEITVYASSDDTLSDSDLIAFEASCTDSNSFTCGPADTTPSAGCVFDSSNKVSCGEMIENYDLSPLITELPITLYLILQSCHAEINDECSTLAKPLTFQ